MTTSMWVVTAEDTNLAGEVGPSHVGAGFSYCTDPRVVNELLGKYICFILPARRGSGTFPASRELQEFFPGRTFLPD